MIDTRSWVADVTELVGQETAGWRQGVKAASPAARAKLRELLREQEGGLAYADRGYTVAEAGTDWLDYGLTGRSPATLTTKRILAAEHLIPALGARKLVELSAEDVDRQLGTQPPPNIENSPVSDPHLRA